MTSEPWDAIVIGAGAAGFMAAIRGAERGGRILLLEKKSTAWCQNLDVRGTRCNLTHATDNRGIVKAYGQSGKFLHSALASLSVDQTIAFFEAEGVKTKREETGKIFPCSNKAADVLQALLGRMERSGAVLALSESVKEITPPLLDSPNPMFLLVTTQRTLLSKKIILTTGGQSYPGSGTTGDGYHWAKSLGHTIVTTRPALVPITSGDSWVADLRGITLPDVVVTLNEGAHRLDERRGSLLFAHFGLTGPVILDLSREVSGHSHPQKLHLEINLLPQWKEERISDFLKYESIASGKKNWSAVLSAHMPKRLAEAVLEQAELGRDRKAAALSKECRGKLTHTLQHLRLSVNGTLGFKKAEVTAGGVSLDEVDSRTMESKRVPNLFFAGEILDLDGPIGGYNFQAAFSTGWLAGSRVFSSRGPVEENGKNAPFFTPFS